MSTPKIDPRAYPKIFKLVTQDGVAQSDVARRFGVSRKTINTIIEGERARQTESFFDNMGAAVEED